MCILPVPAILALPVRRAAPGAGPMTAQREATAILLEARMRVLDTRKVGKKPKPQR